MAVKPLRELIARAPMTITARIERIDPPELNLSGKQVFLHRDRQVIASGEALRITSSGSHRISELSKAWRELISNAEITNNSRNADAGLIALTSISFDEMSSFESVLIIPQRTVVIEGEKAFEVIVGDSEAEPLHPTNGIFHPGQQSDAKFLNSVEAALRAIESNQIEKVVLAKDLLMTIDGKPDLGTPLGRLFERYPECWTYKIDRVFGASPELLLKAEAGKVSARVLAGTAGRGTDPDVDKAIADGLAHSLKNKHEHLYAVQSMVNELRPFCSEISFDEEPFSLALPDLWHLATDVTGTLLPQFTILDVIAQLHPTAAVAGTPRNAAMKLIRELEPFDRGGYAGPVGWLSSNGSGEIAIALRGGVIEDNQIRALAGCGIVSESVPLAELDETELKFKAVRWAFQSVN